MDASVPGGDGSKEEAPAVAVKKRVMVQRASFYCFKCNQLGHRADVCHFFKTRLCKYYQDGTCNRQQNNCLCVYAHGVHELRPGVNVWCNMVVFQDGAQHVYGCGMPGHHITQCCHRQWQIEWYTPTQSEGGASEADQSH